MTRTSASDLHVARRQVDGNPALLLLSAADVNALRAQGSALPGKWSIDYERGRRVENETVAPIMGTGTLTIAVQADSVVLMLESGPRPDGTTPPATRIAGKLSTDGATLVHTQVVTLNMNGEMTTREVTLTWKLQATGDVLSGTFQREMADMPEAHEPTPVKGTRVKS